MRRIVTWSDVWGKSINSNCSHFLFLIRFVVVVMCLLQLLLLLLTFLLTLLLLQVLPDLFRIKGCGPKRIGRRVHRRRSGRSSGRSFSERRVGCSCQLSHKSHIDSIVRQETRVVTVTRFANLIKLLTEHLVLFVWTFKRIQTDDIGRRGTGG